MQVADVKDAVSFLKEWEDTGGDIIEVNTNPNEPWFEDDGSVTKMTYTEYHLSGGSGYAGCLSVWQFNDSSKKIRESFFTEYTADDYDF